MYARLLTAPRHRSFFLLGPRGVGKTAWLRRELPEALFFDLLDNQVYTRLLADPTRLGDLIPTGFANWVVVDEVQRIPELLNEVHRLIETRNLRFALTGSSARKLRRKGVNLLAGRALTRHMHPLTAVELGRDFDLRRALETGGLPMAVTSADPRDYLNSYAATYLREEVQQEGFTRNIAAFSRFLEAASFSQGSGLNMASVARDCAVSAKVVGDYFTILDDLLIAVRLPVFARRAKRRLAVHPKFYYFDPGVFGAIRPRGPLDAASEIHGAALETLILLNLRAINDYLDLGFKLHYWRTATGEEVDFVLYGPRGLFAFEVKLNSRIQVEDLRSLKLFRQLYPECRASLLYTGTRRWTEQDIEIVPVTEWLLGLDRQFGVGSESKASTATK